MLQDKGGTTVQHDWADRQSYLHIEGTICSDHFSMIFAYSGKGFSDCCGLVGFKMTSKTESSGQGKNLRYEDTDKFCDKEQNIPSVCKNRSY